MKFQHHKHDFMHKIYKKCVAIIQVQPSQRPRYFQITSYTFYALDYIILISLIFITKLQYKPKISNEFLYIPFILIALLSLIYVKSQNQILLVMKKIILLMCCFLYKLSLNIFCFCVLPFWALIWGVWALTIEKRKLHYDSRLFVRYPLIKMISLEILIVLMICTDIRIEFQTQYTLFVGFVVFWSYIDYNDLIYNQKFKNVLLFTDLCLTISTLIDLFNDSYLLDNSFDTMQQTLLLSVNIISSYIILYLAKQEYQILFSMNPFSGNHSQNQILHYLLKLDDLCDSNDRFLTNKYLFYHLRQCEDSQCFLQSFHGMRKQLDIDINQSLKRFFIESTQYFAQRNDYIRDYMIHRGCEHSQKTIKLIKMTNFYHFREYDRMIKEYARITNSTSSEQPKAIVLDVDKIVEDKLTSAIKNYLKNSIIFWKQLMEYRIDSQKLFDCAHRQNIQLNWINKFIKSKNIISESKRIRLNQFMCYICKEQKDSLNSTLRLTQKYLSGQMEAPPTLLVSAQKEKFMEIVDLNLAAIKATGFFRNQFIGLNIKNLWNNDLRDTHVKLIQKRSKQCVFASGQVRRSLAFVTNKFGYLVFVDGFVYYMNDIDGKKWCVVLQPYLTGQAIVVCNVRKQIVGVNQYCSYLGLDKDVVGQTMSQMIFEEAVNKKLATKLKGRTLLNKKTPGFDSNPKDVITIKFISQVCFHSVTFYAFTVNKKTTNKNRCSSVYRESLLVSDANYSMSSVSKATNQMMFGSRKVTPPKFQFSYDFTKGMYTNYPVPFFPDLGCSIVFNEDQNFFLEQCEQSENSKIDQITEMRIFNGKIDFIENMPDNKIKLDRFQKIPWANQFNYHQEISQNKYKQVIQKRLNEVSTPIKLLRGFFVVSFIVVTILVICVMVISRQTSDALAKKSQVMMLTNQQYENMVVLGSKTLGIHYEPNGNISESILTKISQIQQIYKQLSLTQTSYNDRLNIKIGNQTFQSITNNYRLILNSFLTNPNPNQIPALELLRDKIYPGWAIVKSKIQMEIQQSMTQQMNLQFIFLGLSLSILTAIKCIYWLLQIYLRNKFKQICLVFKSIPEPYIEHYIQKIQSFKQYIEVGKTYIEDDVFSNVQLNQDADNDQSLYRKRLVNPISLFTPNLCFLFLSLTFMTFFIANFTIRQNAILRHQNYINISSAVSEISIQAQMIWTGLNLFPYNVELLDIYEDRMYTADLNLQVQINKGLEKQYYSSIFKDFLQVFIHKNSCDYFAYSDCQIDINGALKKGMKQMYTYLFRKYDFFMHSVFQPNEFRSLETSQKVYKMHKYYLEGVGNIINNKLKEEEKTKNKQDLHQILLESLLIIPALVFGIICFCLLNKVGENVQKMQVFLSFLPFQYIKKNHKYWKMTIKGYKK